MRLRQVLTGAAFVAASAVVGGAEIDDRRKAIIQNLISHGVFQKVEQPARFPHVWTGRAFDSLSFDDKQTFISVVFAWAYCQGRENCPPMRTGQMVILKDGRTGKQIGVFSRSSGGLRLE